MQYAPNQTPTCDILNQLTHAASRCPLLDTYIQLKAWNKTVFLKLKKRKKPYPISIFKSKLPLNHTSIFCLPVSLIWDLSLSNTEAHFSSNGSSDRVRCGVPVLLLRLHQVPPPDSPPSLLLHLLKKIIKNHRNVGRLSAKTWNGLVRKCFVTSFYKYVHVRAFVSVSLGRVWSL